ncbi:hypothetical protein PGT21_017235 [Puccinia graminis f. sp. tritici]|uniref:Reverse transcriptase domain-containing protein n=1 Tax=Puccinia graminis f. sp. tritici TaxID=56615 RepID=A0A5B0ML65_PUCGR|nr:hypothetical protein PGT21_017235 [Puccinia graminis f. sp. tritici]
MSYRASFAAPPNLSHLRFFDWEKAYRQIPTAMDQWPFLLVKNFEDMLLLDTRITFGGVSGCGSFGLPADAWKAIMLHEFDLISIFRWVDNNLFVKNIDSQTEMEDIVSRSNELGVKTNDEKFSPFATEQKHIGFVWNGVDKTVRLPDGKLFDRVNQLKTFAKLERFSYHNVEVMTGRLNHNDLEQWMHTLLTFKPTCLIPNPTPTEIGHTGGIAWLETVAIRLGLLMLESLGIKHGKKFIVWTDNTTTENAIRKRKSRDPSVNKEWKIIQDLLVKLQADIDPRRVRSESNTADSLSRGIGDGHEWRHVVPIHMP